MVMTQFRTILCDICKEKPMIKSIEIARFWKGVCADCEKKILEEKENQK